MRWAGPVLRSVQQTHWKMITFRGKGKTILNRNLIWCHPKKVIFVQRLLLNSTFLFQGCAQEPHSFLNCWYYSAMFFFLLCSPQYLYLGSCILLKSVPLDAICKIHSNSFFNCQFLKHLFELLRSYKKALKGILTKDLIMYNSNYKNNVFFLKINNVLK